MRSLSGLPRILTLILALALLFPLLFTQAQAQAQATPPCEPHYLPGDGAYEGKWDPDAGCKSVARPGSYAQYYIFDLYRASTVTITLEAYDADTYLYLRQGEAVSGTFLHEDDDSPDTSRSRILADLVAGTYTIEATTYGAGEEDWFFLEISGLDAIPDGSCAEWLGQPYYDFEVYEWLDGRCPSGSREGSYSYFYTFELDAPTEMSFATLSDMDTYLFLIQGPEPGGEVLAENDDIDDSSGDRTSRIPGTPPETITLEAGVYTIEVTTYGAGETGDFVLLVSGLWTAQPEPPAPQECAVGLELSEQLQVCFLSDDFFISVVPDGGVAVGAFGWDVFPPPGLLITHTGNNVWRIDGLPESP